MAPVAVSVLASMARAIPKSMTLRPSSVSRMLAGLRSRCTRLARWMSARAAASPAASRSTASLGNGPCAFTALCRVGPATNSVAIQGTRASVSPARTRAVYRPCTACAALTSRRNRSRKPGLSMNWPCTRFTAASVPSVLRPRRTRPIAPEPSTAIIR